MTADVGGSATDAEFAAGFQRDPELFTAVYDRYFRDVYRYVAGRLDTEAADDIAAETFMVAFGQRARYDPGRGGLRRRGLPRARLDAQRHVPRPR